MSLQGISLMYSIIIDGVYVGLYTKNPYDDT